MAEWRKFLNKWKRRIFLTIVFDSTLNWNENICSLLIKNKNYGKLFEQIVVNLILIDCQLEYLRVQVFSQEKQNISKLVAMINDPECDTIKYVIGKLLFQEWIL